MKKIKVIAFVLAFMLPQLSCYSQSTNKKIKEQLSNRKMTLKRDNPKNVESNQANSAKVANFIDKLMSNKQDSSKQVDGIPTNPATPANHIARDNATTVRNNDKGKSYLSCPDNNHPHQIDLGLPSGTKWACCNVGANRPEGYGGYYAWGETKEKEKYNAETYIHSDGSYKTMHNIGVNICGTLYDIAHVKWGGSWRMPSCEQIKELSDKCSFEWMEINGIKGGMLTGLNGNSIFLPAAGQFHYLDDYAVGVGRYIHSWSGTLNQNPKHDGQTAYYLDVDSIEVEVYSNKLRTAGFSVRPVAP